MYFMLSFSAIKRGEKDLTLQKGKSNYKKVYNGYSYPLCSLEKDHKHQCLQCAEQTIIINSEGRGKRPLKLGQG